MAGSVNKVILVGNVGQDPEVRQFQNGGQVCSFSLATSENWKDKNTGERREKTEWHRISVFNEGLIRVIQSYVKKGSKLYIEGQLETRKWQDQNGQDRYSTEVVLQGYNGNLTMLDGKSSGNMNDNEFNQAPAASGGSAPVAQGSAAVDLDDEIPF